MQTAIWFTKYEHLLKQIDNAWRYRPGLDCTIALFPLQHILKQPDCTGWVPLDMNVSSHTDGGSSSKSLPQKHVGMPLCEEPLEERLTTREMGPCAHRAHERTDMPPLEGKRIEPPITECTGEEFLRRQDCSGKLPVKAGRKATSLLKVVGLPVSRARSQVADDQTVPF